jgi:hypothetical protein
MLRSADLATSTLQGLYESEINHTVSAFWDCGFRWKLGDDLNGLSPKEWPQHSSRPLGSGASCHRALPGQRLRAQLSELRMGRTVADLPPSDLTALVLVRRRPTGPGLSLLGRALALIPRRLQ